MKDMARVLAIVLIAALPLTTAATVNAGTASDATPEGAASKRHSLT